MLRLLSQTDTSIRGMVNRLRPALSHSKPLHLRPNHIQSALHPRPTLGTTNPDPDSQMGVKFPLPTPLPTPRDPIPRRPISAFCFQFFSFSPFVPWSVVRGPTFAFPISAFQQTAAVVAADPRQANQTCVKSNLLNIDAR